jgi:hypothetical protein
VFKEKIEDPLLEALLSSITKVTHIHNPFGKHLYLVTVKPLEIKLPSMMLSKGVTRSGK